MMAVWKPLSLFEREELARKLRLEAAEKIAEAERIEEGCRSDNERMVEAAKEAFRKIELKGINHD